MPRHLNQLAKAVVDFATGEREPDPPGRMNAAAVELERLGGKIGGKARATNLTEEQRRDSARNAALARWSKPRP